MRHFNDNDIVYFISGDNVKGHYVNYGIVYDEFSDGVCIDYLVIKDNRLINGIPFNDFVTPTKWQKLPNKWTFNTKLFELSWKDFENDLSNYHINNPKELKNAYDIGLLIKATDYDDGHIETEIDKNKGWRLVKKYNPYNVNPKSTTIPWFNVYNTYEEALDTVNKIDAEILRQASLSDLEWSVEQIDKTLKHYLKITNNETYCNNVRNYLMSFENLEDLEIRIFDNQIQWKYWKNKKWNTIDNNSFV